MQWWSEGYSVIFLTGENNSVKLTPLNPTVHTHVGALTIKCCAAPAQLVLACVVFPPISARASQSHSCHCFGLSLNTEFQIARMASLQSRIDLPARKPGRSKRLEKMVEKEEATIGRRSSRSKGPAEEVEELPRTPRGKKKALVKAPSPQISPGKRKGGTEPSGGSPNKQSRTPAKGRGAKENTGMQTPLTPATQLSNLSLNSPLSRQPLSSLSQPQAPARKGPLFSPGKISAENIADLLDSPQKSPVR